MNPRALTSSQFLKEGNKDKEGKRKAYVPNLPNPLFLCMCNCHKATDTVFARWCCVMRYCLLQWSHRAACLGMRVCESGEEGRGRKPRLPHVVLKGGYSNLFSARAWMSPSDTSFVSLLIKCALTHIHSHGKWRVAGDRKIQQYEHAVLGTCLS